MKLKDLFEEVENQRIDTVEKIVISLYGDDSETIIEQCEIDGQLLLESEKVYTIDDMMFLEKKEAITLYDDDTKPISKSKMIDLLLKRIEETNEKAKAGKLNKAVKIAKITYITTKGSSSSEFIWSRTKSYYDSLSTDPKDIEAAKKREKTNKEKGQMAFVCSPDGAKIRTIKLSKITGFKFNNGKVYSVDNSTAERKFPDFRKRLEIEAKVVGKAMEEASKSVKKALNQFKVDLPKEYNKTAEEFEQSILKRVVLDNSRERRDSIIAAQKDKERREKGEESLSSSKWFSIQVDSFKGGVAKVIASLSLIKMAEALGAELPLNKKGDKVFSKATPDYERYKKEIQEKIGHEYTITARSTAWAKAEFTAK